MLSKIFTQIWKTEVHQASTDRFDQLCIDQSAPIHLRVPCPDAHSPRYFTCLARARVDSHGSKISGSSASGVRSAVIGG